jgi:hypothetical protein
MRIPNHPLLAMKPHTVPVLPLYSAEAGGMAAGRPQSATDGLASWVSDRNQEWFWNPTMNEWQLAHTVRSGDTLWQLTKTYYGSFSRGGVTAIHEVPQNLAIQGPDPDIGLIPGDVILIPHLPQPNTPPASSSTLPAVANVPPPPGPPDVTPPGVGQPSTVAAAAPPGWPAGVPYPPTADTNIIVPTNTPTGGVLTTTSTGGHAQPAPFWTKGRIALAVGTGVVGLGTVVYLLSRPKRRSNPRRYRR